MLRSRLATTADLPQLRAIMALAIETLQHDFLDPAQVQASHAVMGLDTQLIEDGTYFVIEDDGIVGCGGWGRRRTLYGGDHSISLRSNDLLDPTSEPARIRAMYTHPDHVRRGIGRMVLALSEKAAAREGFKRCELMSTLAGEPLYAACGYTRVRDEQASVDGVIVPLILMEKEIADDA